MEEMYRRTCGKSRGNSGNTTDRHESFASQTANVSFSRRKASRSRQRGGDTRTDGPEPEPHPLRIIEMLPPAVTPCTPFTRHKSDVKPRRVTLKCGFDRTRNATAKKMTARATGNVRDMLLPFYIFYMAGMLRRRENLTQKARRNKNWSRQCSHCAPEKEK